MKLTAAETRFLTALAREQNQSGCKGPAHELLRKHAYPDAPPSGPNSLAFSYETVPLTSLLLSDCSDLQDIDDFLRKGSLIADPEWPWSSPGEYRSRLEEAKQTRRALDLHAKSLRLRQLSELLITVADDITKCIEEHNAELRREERGARR